MLKESNDLRRLQMWWCNPVWTGAKRASTREREGRRSPVRTRTWKTRRGSGGPVKTGKTLRCLSVGAKANVRNVGRSCLKRRLDGRA
ncbi:hypothetical protein Taro_044454 [Colocasia esculenta]|uniref:Uncharacterized protein n=1 Tax=Colocasia esculenta TaxID=4460 RepID=A0A843WYD3_COLES|nr:hypothetical protein [Colocasia esculenta]